MTDSTNSSTDRSAAALNSPEATRDDHVELGGPVELDEMSIRGAMSEFTTGVTIIATEDEGEAYGFACQSFSSLSLTPPMVLFTVMKDRKSVV